jgi:hypothetical protein
MKIKKPSLKGMKNTKYLGHFAQDKYIQKGHNLSGVLPMTQQVQMSAGTATNPFDYANERQRRLDYQRQQSLAEAQRLRSGAPTVDWNAVIKDPTQAEEDKQIKNKTDRDSMLRAADLLSQDPTGEKGLNKKKFIDII